MARQVNLDDYDPELVDTVRVWVEFCGELISIDARNIQHLRQGLRNLGVRAQQLYPELESGGRPMLSVEDLGPFPLPEGVGETYVMVTGTILFNGADGPAIAAERLEQALDTIRGTLIARAQDERRERETRQDVAPANDPE